MMYMYHGVGEVRDEVYQEGRAKTTERTLSVFGGKVVLLLIHHLAKGTLLSCQN